MNKIALKMVATFIAILPYSSTSFAQVYDDFSIPLKWTAFSYGSGKPYSIQTNEKLEIDIPSNSVGRNYGAGYTTLCNFHGDFDVQVDYELVDFPSSNGVRVGITAGNIISKSKWGMGAEVVRISWGISENQQFTDAYITHINKDCCHDISTSDKSGKLRVTRNNNLLSGYYYDNSFNQWILISSNTVKLGDTPIEIGAWSHDNVFSQQPIKINFDNFVINKGSLTGKSCLIK